MLVVVLAAAALVPMFVGFYHWARGRGLLAPEPPGLGGHEPRRVSSVTEAVAYIGAALLLAGGGVALGERWEDLAEWAHVGVFAAAAALFLVVGLLVYRVREPAVQRLVGVVWLLSAVGVAAAAGLATGEVFDRGGDVTSLAVGIALAGYAALLWLVRRRAPQHAALFVGLVIAICGAVATVTSGPAPNLAFTLALWPFGVVWAVLAWRRYTEPLWFAMPLGVILALFAPSVAVADHGWVHGLGIVTAAAVLAAGVPLRNGAMLGLGSVAMFGYVTATMVRYFGDSLGVPATLAITGALILALAVLSARLMRAARGRPSREQDPGRASTPQPTIDDRTHHPVG